MTIGSVLEAAPDGQKGGERRQSERSTRGSMAAPAPQQPVPTSASPLPTWACSTATAKDEFEWDDPHVRCIHAVPFYVPV